MLDINPITTSFLTAAEYDSGVDSTKPFKYVLEPDGSIMYITSMSAGREVVEAKTKVDGLATGTERRDELVQPLAYGHKMPEEFFTRIERFFLDVLDKVGGRSQLEAQIFVIWNETRQEYRLYVPEQEVSAAAVRYDISNDLESDDVIIMDVHSHNNMGAFYSGTDDRDDKKNTWISGVFGKISSNLEYLFRFNDGAGNHYDLNYEDIFDVQEVVNPGEWLERVRIQSAGYRASASAVGGPTTLEDSDLLAMYDRWDREYEGFPEMEGYQDGNSSTPLDDSIVEDLVEGIEDVIGEHPNGIHNQIIEEIANCINDANYMSPMACDENPTIQGDFMILHNYLEGFDKPSVLKALNEASK